MSNPQQFERAADMLTAYGELIRRDGASRVEEHHYAPEVEAVAAELRALSGRASRQIHAPELAEGEGDDPRAPVVTGSPDTIWLCYGDLDRDATHRECVEVLWCEDKQHPSDVRYVRADAGRVAPASDGLQLAVKLLAQIGDERSDAAIAAVHDLAEEHARLQHAYHHQREDAQARVDAAVVRALAAEKACDEAQLLADGTGADAYAHCCDNVEAWMRKRGHETSGPEGTLCGWVDWAMAAVSERDELRARLAEIEAQEHKT